MSDGDLEAIRQKRMQEMQSQVIILISAEILTRKLHFSYYCYSASVVVIFDYYCYERYYYNHYHRNA